MENTRRKFIKQNTAIGAGIILGGGFSTTISNATGLKIVPSDKPAILGGQPVFGNGKSPQWPKWPLWIPQTDEPAVLKVLRSGVWSRAKTVNEFEGAFASLLGAKACLTTVNGTNALICALKNLNVGWGDEVIVTPYTFIATIQAILQVGAMPVFADIDPETFQIDPDKIEEKISAYTRAILPVHIAGLPTDMDPIIKIANKNKLVVVEDACQAHLAEYNHKKVGTFGDAGCFSFQNSKNLPIGEGGAIVSNNTSYIDKCYSYHNYGIAHGDVIDSKGKGIVMLGTKLRLTEYQAAIGLVQLKRLEQQTEKRNKNAPYLRSQLELIPGITPYKLYPKVNRAAYHLFPFRYKKSYFEQLSRDKFLEALRAEGVPCSRGYATLNNGYYLMNTFLREDFKKVYSDEQLNWNYFLEKNQCPQNDLICNEEAVWFEQNLLLGTKQDMDYIALAIQKIYKNAAILAEKL